jgi:uncharacterized membrane protein YbaN (DUF454 family)
VVFPTPPFWLTTAKILATKAPTFHDLRKNHTYTNKHTEYYSKAPHGFQGFAGKKDEKMG